MAHDKKFIEEMRSVLEDKKERILKELSIFESEGGDDLPSDWKSRFPSFGHSTDDHAQEVASFTDRLSLNTALEKTLKDIDKALSLLEKGNYGICAHCGKDIAQARLKARPFSSSCVACKKHLKGEL